jgi:hypothetical protein
VLEEVPLGVHLSLPVLGMTRLPPKREHTGACFHIFVHVESSTFNPQVVWSQELSYIRHSIHERNELYSNFFFLNEL